jgi:acyl-coenzyme A thioesterase PaaI-like protein
MKRLFQAAIMRRLINCWPPFLFSGIKIVALSQDYCYCKVELKSRPWTKNINHSQFGGSMFSMTDPIYPLMLMAVLGEQYFVWDRQAEINFLQPGKGKLYAEFYLTEDRLQQIMQATAQGDKYFPQFRVDIKDSADNVVCEVQRTLYVRKKAQYRPE